MNERVYNQDQVDTLLLNRKLDEVKLVVDNIAEKLETNYVTKERFELEVNPLKKIIYTMIGLICTGVLAAVLALVNNK